jgi:hypothetical protein
MIATSDYSGRDVIDQILRYVDMDARAISRSELRIQKTQSSRSGAHLAADGQHRVMAVRHCYLMTRPLP